MIEIIDRDKIMPMFEFCNDSTLLSYSEGILGKGYSEKNENPAWAAVVAGDLCFVAGQPCNIEGLSDIIKNIGRNVVVIPQSESWQDKLNEYGCNLVQTTRHMLKAPEHFDLEKLEKLSSEVGKIEGAELVKVGKKEYNILKDCKWENSFVANFKNCEDFVLHGLGYVIKINDEIAAGATTFAYYSRGVEVQIATNPKYQKMGLATICSAAFIIECVQRDLKPHWDAANKISLKIAEKMGYNLLGDYSGLIVKV